MQKRAIVLSGRQSVFSPKKPAMVEAVALNLADNADAKMETLTELFDAAPAGNEWLGYNRFFESNIRRTGDFS